VAHAIDHQTVSTPSPMSGSVIEIDNCPFPLEWALEPALVARDFKDSLLEWHATLEELDRGNNLE